MTIIDPSDISTIIVELLRSKNFRQYNIPLAKKLGRIEYAVLITDMLDEYLHYHENGDLISHIKYGDGLMYYTIEKAYDRCAMNKDSFESGLKLFIELGFIKDVVKFGNPCRKYFRLDIKAICTFISSNKDYSLRNSSNKFAETRKQVCGNPQRNESNNESKKKSNNRLFSHQQSKKIHPKSEKSSFSKKQDIVFFDPITYVLKNGQRLKPQTAKTYAKKMQDPKQDFIIRNNISWYEKQIEAGISPNNHEAYLQNAINKNIAGKIDRSYKNDFYAKFMKEEHRDLGINIKKSVVQLDKRDGNKYESISLDLPEETFANILENFINTQRNKEKIS